MEENPLESANEECDAESLKGSKDKLSKAFLICIAYSATIGGTTSLTGTGATMVLKGVTEELYGEEAGITFANWIYFMLPMTILSIFMCWILLQYFFLGRRCCLWVRDCRCCTQESDEGKAVRELIQREYSALGDVSFAEMGVFIHFVGLIALWLFRRPAFIPTFEGWSQIFLIPNYIDDATTAMVIALSLTFFPSKMPWFIRRIFGKVDKDDKARPVEPLLTWESLQRRLPWHIVLLIGGGFALAKGCEESGLSGWLGDLFSALSGIPQWLIVFILSTTLCMFTEITSNVTTATIFLPICASLSEGLCMNPLYLMIAATIACTNAFMLPAANPPTTIVFAYGTVSIPDLVKAGMFQNVVGVTLINILVNTMGTAVYDVLKFPSWASNDACVANATVIAD
ncbi:Solute carrier family 13 member 3 [Holothuria leucospilota]|uniref:Solute carrier family 13 member 3 n=1 Tax=Holothuria leucospilota TaxID=206669 RepID=A0A9Q0YT56_HOLLE|nr:Solute carrier family 13 member 3 [Holothuria leucospilota]